MCLEKLHRNLEDFWDRFVTIDETRIHNYTLDIKWQLKQWVREDESASKKVLSAGQVMDTVFCGSQGNIIIAYLKKS